jgi:hypothetical protein
MNQKPKLFNADQVAETREEIHAEVRDWFPTAETLAQQLGTDSRRLAKLYPAPNTASLLAQMLREQAAADRSAASGSTIESLLDESSLPALTIASIDEHQNEETAAPREASRLLVWPLPQAAAAALLLIAGWSLMHWSAEQPLAPGRDLNKKVAEQPRKETVIPVVFPTAPLEPQEFQTLSAPEREAVLDLLEEQDLGTVSLSI